MLLCSQNGEYMLRKFTPYTLFLSKLLEIILEQNDIQTRNKRNILEAQ